jgi:hypothetical protein
LQEYGEEVVERILQRESVVRIGLPATEPLGPPLANPATLLFNWIDMAEALNEVYDYSQWIAANEGDDYAYRREQIYNYLLHQVAIQLVPRDPGVRVQWDARAQHIYEQLMHQTLTYETWLAENSEQLMQIEQEQRSERRWVAAP